MDLQKENEPRHVLPDKLINFFASFEDNTVPPTQPATKACGLSFSMDDTSKTFKRVNLRKGAGPKGIPSASSEHAQTSWQGVLRTYSNIPYPSLLSPHASR
jgi:hypothetical protein